MVETVWSWIKWIDLPSLFLGIGSTFGAIGLQHYLGQGKLMQTGGGSGVFISIRIQNSPGFFGCRFGPTLFLGKRVLPGFSIGIPFDRSPARACFATVIDKESGQSLGYAAWQVNGKFQHEVTLESGDAADLILFSKFGVADGKYYLWQPHPDGALNNPPSANAIQMEGSKEFFVDVHFAHGQRKRRFNCKIIRQLEGSYRFETGSGGGSLI